MIEFDSVTALGLLSEQGLINGQLYTVTVVTAKLILTNDHSNFLCGLQNKIQRRLVNILVRFNNPYPLIANNNKTYPRWKKWGEIMLCYPIFSQRGRKQVPLGVDSDILCDPCEKPEQTLKEKKIEIRVGEVRCMELHVPSRPLLLL